MMELPEAGRRPHGGLPRNIGAFLLAAVAALGCAGPGGPAARLGAGPGPAPRPRRVHLAWVDATAPEGARLIYATRAGGESSWTLRVLDPALLAGRNVTTASVELALDSAGNPHVAYLSAGRKELRYTRWDGAGWVRMNGTPGHDVVDADVDYTAVARNFLALEGDRPHLVFRKGTDLRYYRWSGRAWEKETALTLYPPAGEANPGGNPALTIDARGTVHVAHHDHGRYRIHYARRDGGRWTNETTSSPEMSSLYKRIMLDGGGHPHITFSGGYLRHDGSRWVDAAGAPGYDALDARFVSAGLTPSGEILLGVRTPEGLALRRKALDGGAWSAPELVYAAPRFLAADVESDREGDAHVVISSGGLDALDVVYVHREGGRWVAETVATGPGFHRFVHPALAVE